MDLVNLHFLRLLVKHNALEWVLLPLPKYISLPEYQGIRSKTFFTYHQPANSVNSKNYSSLFFRTGRCEGTSTKTGLINCPQFHKRFLDSYFFKLYFGSVCFELFGTATFETIFKKKATVQFLKT